MITFSNKYNIGDVVNYVKLDYRGGKKTERGEIRRIMFIKDKDRENLLYLIGTDTVPEEFIQ